MRFYFKVDNSNIVTETLQTNDVVSSEYIETTQEIVNTGLLGKRWNGSTFEEVPTEETEVPETTEVTNEDLLEVLLAIGEKVGA